jgi:hypothetical protein
VAHPCISNLKYILSTGHTYGSITDTMIIKTEKGGKYLNTLEKDHIYKISKTYYT